MSDTVPCPLCGEDDGYTTEYLQREECLLVLCRWCMGPVAKAEDKRFVDDAWNYACAHAQALRERIRAMGEAMDQVIQYTKTKRIRLGNDYLYAGLDSGEVGKLRELLTQAREQK